VIKGGTGWHGVQRIMSRRRSDSRHEVWQPLDIKRILGMSP
jgi:hypothetical protein